MRLTEFPTGEVQAKLEELLRSGWAFLIADNDVIRAVEMNTEPEDFSMMIIPRGRQPMLKIIVLIRATTFLSKEPDREKIRAIWCRWKEKPEHNIGELVVMKAAFEDEEIGALVERVLEE